MIETNFTNPNRNHFLDNHVYITMCRTDEYPSISDRKWKKPILNSRNFTPGLTKEPFTGIM